MTNYISGNVIPFFLSTEKEDELSHGNTIQLVRKIHNREKAIFMS